MATPLDCPAPEGWQALLGDTLPPAQRQRYEQHLESCPGCQERLDRSREPGGALRRLGRQLGDPTAGSVDPTLTQFLERLHQAKGLDRTSPAEPVDLGFLRPADRPGILGLLGDYEVLEVIGQGGMGVVLRAFEPALDRHVAIKVMAPALAGSAIARQRFTREAHAAAAVRHEHIVTVHGVADGDGLPYLVMQYVAGESLQARLDRTGPLEVVEVVRIGLETASGLAAAHAQGLIHRDIKPANLLLEGGLAKVRITDFGLARMTDDVALTQAGMVAGTPEYMAPEQARGEGIDQRADLFSLGSVLYACCTGGPPFRGPTALAVLRRVSEEAPAPLHALNPAVPAWLEALVTRLLTKDPAERFQSAAEVASLLEGYLAHLLQPEVPAPPLPSPPERGPGRSDTAARTRMLERLRQRPWLSAFLLLAGVGLGLGLIGWGLAGGGRGPAPESPGQARNRLVFDLRKGVDDLPAFALFGPDAEDVIRPEAQGLRITLPAGRPDCRIVGGELSLRLRGDFDIDLGYEILAIGDNIPDPAAGVQMRLAFDAPSIPLVALARFRNRYAPQPAPLFQVVGHDGETFAAYRITILPDAKEKPEGVDVRASEPRGRLRLTRLGSLLQYLVSDGESPYQLIRSEEVGTVDVQSLRLCGFSGWGPVAVDVRFTDLAIDANEFPDGVPQRVVWEKGWLAAGLLLGLVLTSGLALGVCLLVRARRYAGRMPVGRPARSERAKPDAAAATECGEK